MTTASGILAETQAEHALRIIESMPAFAWAADASGRFTYVSPNTQAYLGTVQRDLDPLRDEDEFGWRRVVHPEDYDRVAARWRHCLQTGEHYDTEHRLRRADGMYRWFRNSGRPLRDSQGRITGWYGTTLDIEEQKQVERALRDRERELSQLVDMVPSHLWRLTPDGEPTFFNKRMVDFLGMDVADTDKPGMTRLEAMIAAGIHPEDAAAFGDALRRCLATGEAFAMRYRLRCADGAYHWMSSRAEPLRDQDGRIVQWYGLCHDIDDQMRADEALRQSGRRLQQLVDAVPVMIWSTTREGMPTYLNKRYIDVTGATLEDLVAPDGSSSPLAVAHPDDRAAAAQVRARAFETGSSYAVRYRQIRRDGSYRWTETRAEPLRDESGAILQWYGVAVDIHDMVTAQQALHDRERELSQLVDMVPVYIRRLTPEGEPIFFNKRLTDFIGVGLAELGTSGMSRLAPAVENFVHPDEAGSLLAAIRHSVATGESYARKYRMRRSDGVYRWMETRAEPVRNHDGTIVQWYVISIDVDDEVRAQEAEEALRQASGKLAQATQAASLAELSASIAHEVNQPLAAVVANSHACQRWLRSEPPNLERAQITVERIIRDANAAADVVSRIRALFKQSVETRSYAALHGVIDEARNLMAEEAARRRVYMDVDVESGLPHIAFDRVQIQQVLINLIRNGMDAMDAAAGDKILGMRVRRMGDVVQTEISDRGHGVEFHNKIFEPFFTTKEHGMGMGLAICRSIVESHDGRLWVEKNEPQGARFIFTLPVEAKAVP